MNTAPDALLLISSACPYCKQVLQHLSELIKNAELGSLKVINIAVHPEAAAQAGTRSVPWTRIGDLELAGNYTLGELREWAQKASAGSADTAYIEELLREQQLEKAVDFVRTHPTLMHTLLKRSQDADLDFSTRLGISALFEELTGSAALQELVPELGQMSRAENPALRADAAHYLGLSGATEAMQWLHPLLQDSSEEVREIANESLQLLQQEAT